MIKEEILSKVYSRFKNILSVAISFGKILEHIDSPEVITVVDDVKPQLLVEEDVFKGKPIRLIVASKHLLQGDVYYDVLGGHLAARLTTLTEILDDKKLWLKSLIREYRQRIVLRELSLLASYGRIMEYAKIPYNYFPIKNLSMYAKVDSELAKTLLNAYSALGEDLLGLMSRDYRSVVEAIAIQHKLKLEDNHVKITHTNRMQALLSKTASVVKEIVVPITYPILCLLLGKSREQKRLQSLPLIFSKPHLLIEMDIGKLALGDWRQVVESMLGMIRKKGKYSVIDTAELYEYEDGLIVVKQYLAPTGIKWVLASIVAIMSKKFSVLPSERQFNEYRMTIKLEKEGLPVREIFVVDPISYTTVFRYIEGITISELINEDFELALKVYRLMGLLLADIHSVGVVLGDTKPENFVYNKYLGEVYPIDLEQSRETTAIEERAWDIAMFVYFHFNKPFEKVSKLLEEFLLGYREHMGVGTSRDIVNESAKVKYMLPFASIAPIQQLLRLQSLLKA